MNENKRPTRADQIVTAFLAPLFLVGGTLLILFFTLKDFNFNFGQLAAHALIDGYILYPSSPLDFLRNVLLFIPFGFGLSAILTKRGWPANRVRLAVVLSGFLLSLTVETLQNFLPERQPAIADLFSNTLGAFLGLGCYRLWQNRSDMTAWLREAVVTLPKMLLGVALYLLALLLIAGSLAKDVQLTGWDLQYRMLVGNEGIGKRRVWQGTARDLIIVNKALKPDAARQIMEDPERSLSLGDDLQAYYPLHDEAKQVDLTGKQPDLVWRSTENPGEYAAPAQLNGLHWLETEPPVSDLSAQLQSSSQFSIRLTVGTADLAQAGPARIVTISEDLSFRNLTLGQAKDALVIRFRSPFTAANGVSPEFLFPGFFTTNEANDFVVIFDGLALSVVDGRSQDIASVELVPSAVFYEELDASLPWYWQLNVGSFDDGMYRLLFYGLTLLPLGIYIALPALAAWPRRRFPLFFVLCLLAVPFLFEWGFDVHSGAEPRPLNILISALILFIVAGVTAVGFHIWGRLRRNTLDQNGQGAV